MTDERMKELRSVLKRTKTSTLIMALGGGGSLIELHDLIWPDHVLPKTPHGKMPAPLPTNYDADLNERLLDLIVAAMDEIDARIPTRKHDEDDLVGKYFGLGRRGKP